MRRLIRPALLAGAVALADGKFAMRASSTDGRETDDDVFVLDTKRVKVGTAAAPSTITKTVHFPIHSAIPRNKNEDYLAGVVSVEPALANTSIDLYLPLYLPEGVTITAFRLRSYRATTSDIANALLYRVESDSNTLLATLAHDSTGWQTKTASLSESVAAGRHYTAHVGLKGVAFAPDAKAQWFEITYTVPDYGTGI
jgi:hypothetical protein